MQTTKANATYDVIVLGAGAAGLMCALTAAGRGRSVLLLEKANKPGKKILMSGGGRCNFTNLYVEPENFICTNPHFCKSALSRYAQWDFIAMVARHGIEYEERSHGQLFCVHSAKEILAMLLQECQDVNVELRAQCDIQAVYQQASQEHERYAVSLHDEHTVEHIACQSLVVATGALSIPTLGGSGMGYDIATQFKLPLLPRRAGLVPFMFSDSTRELCERLAGVSVEAEVRCAGQSFTEKVLFTHRGISGPAVLQISNYWQPGEAIELDLLPGVDAKALLLDAKRAKGSNRLNSILAKTLPRALVTQLQALWWPQRNESALADFSDIQLANIGERLNNWTLKPSATEGYRTAEVTLGGVDTDAISSKTMEARDHPGLYFIGEVVDVTGHLGGFNFQWAWSSGYTAGLFA